MDSIGAVYSASTRQHQRIIPILSGGVDSDSGYLTSVRYCGCVEVLFLRPRLTASSSTKGMGSKDGVTQRMGSGLYFAILDRRHAVAKAAVVSHARGHWPRHADSRPCTPGPSAAQLSPAGGRPRAGARTAPPAAPHSAAGSGHTAPPRSGHNPGTRAAGRPPRSAGWAPAADAGFPGRPAGGRRASAAR